MILKIGSKGKEVKSLQEYLGIYADGDFGPNTEKYVKKWQSENGLSADGIALSRVVKTNTEPRNGFIPVINI